jgi:hypothetical protein
VRLTLFLFWDLSNRIGRLVAAEIFPGGSMEANFFLEKVGFRTAILVLSQNFAP